MGARDKVTKRRRGKEGVEWGGGPNLGREGCTWIFVQGLSEFSVTLRLMVPVCLLGQGRFEEWSALMEFNAPPDTISVILEVWSRLTASGDTEVDWIRT